MNKEIFVDNKQFKVLFRDQRSATGEVKIEQDANAFAASLLMPKNLLMKEINKKNFDLSDENSDAIGELAKKFKVSVQAMTFRLMNLSVLQSY